MNYCTKCASYYQTPGSCNCYAGTAPRVYPINPRPWQPTWVPWYPATYPWITWTADGTNTLPSFPITNNTGALPSTGITYTMNVT